MGANNTRDVLKSNYDAHNDKYNLCDAYRERYKEEPPAMLAELESIKPIRSSQVAALAIVTARHIADLDADLDNQLFESVTEPEPET